MLAKLSILRALELILLVGLLLTSIRNAVLLFDQSDRAELTRVTD